MIAPRTSPQPMPRKPHDRRAAGIRGWHSRLQDILRSEAAQAARQRPHDLSAEFPQLAALIRAARTARQAEFEYRGARFRLVRGAVFDRIVGQDGNDITCLGGEIFR